MPRPYRPSETTKFTRCPTLWLREDVQGWRRPDIPFSPEILMGTAIHAGLAALWRRETAHKWAVLNVFEALWPAEGGGAHDRERLETLALQCVMETITWCQATLGEVEPLLIEQSLDEDDHTTPDLVFRRAGGIEIIDWKYHHEIDLAKKPWSLQDRLEEVARVHQFQDYCWRVGEYLQEPVRLFRAIHIIGQPKIVVREAAFQPSAAAQAEWLRQARRKWHQMGMIATEPALAWRNENGCKMYGEKWPCPQWAGCWECSGDPEQMAQFYVKEG